MNTTLRTITVSAAALAVLGLAGTATAADLTTADHHQAVAVVAADSSTPQPFAELNRPTGTNPATFTNTPQQVTTQSGAGIAAGTTGVIILGFLVWYAAKHHGQKWFWLIVSFSLGVALSTSVLGNLSTSLVNSGVSAVSSVASSIQG